MRCFQIHRKNKEPEQQWIIEAEMHNNKATNKIILSLETFWSEHGDCFGRGACCLQVREDETRCRQRLTSQYLKVSPRVTDFPKRNFQYKLSLLSFCLRTPWGRERSYAGLMSVNLPRGHRPKAEPPEKVEKGHKHFGSGVNAFPR